MDHNKKQRYLKVEQAFSSAEWLVSCGKSAYLLSGCALKLLTTEETDPNQDQFNLGKFAGEPLDIRLFKDDLIVLTPAYIDGKPAEYNDNGILFILLKLAAHFLQPWINLKSVSLSGLMTANWAQLSNRSPTKARCCALLLLKPVVCAYKVTKASIFQKRSSTCRP